MRENKEKGSKGKAALGLDIKIFPCPSQGGWGEDLKIKLKIKYVQFYLVSNITVCFSFLIKITILIKNEIVFDMLIFQYKNNI